MFCGVLRNKQVDTTNLKDIGVQGVEQELHTPFEDQLARTTSYQEKHIPIQRLKYRTLLLLTLCIEPHLYLSAVMKKAL